MCAHIRSIGLVLTSVEKIVEKSEKIGKSAIFSSGRFFTEEKSRFLKKAWKRAFLEKSAKCWRYVHFIHCFSIFCHGLFERFFAYLFYYFIAYFLSISLLFVFTILPLIFMPQKMKNSPNVNGGFKKLEWKIACFFFSS